MGVKGWRRGTHRAVPPAETVARVRPLMPRLGITRLADVTGLDRIGLPVFQAVRPLSRSVSVAQGKGLTADAARASALMEAAETWCAERVRLPLRHAREADLQDDGEAVADTARLPRETAGTYDPERPILWAAGRALGKSEGDAPPVWVPYEMVHADYTLPPPAGSGVFVASTNGLASGNDRDEAVVHALCELVERHAVARWRALPRRDRAATRLRLDALDDPDVAGVVGLLRRAGFRVAAWDATGELGVATVFAAIVDERDLLGHPGSGSGCHPCREVAMLRALTEAAQVRCTYVAGARDDLGPAAYQPAAVEALRRSLEALMGSADDGPLSPGSVTTAEEDDATGDVALVAGRLAAAGMDAPVILDLGREGMPFAVVRAIVPGLDPPDDLPGVAPGPGRGGKP